MNHLYGISADVSEVLLSLLLLLSSSPHPRCDEVKKNSWQSIDVSVESDGCARLSIESRITSE